MSDDTLVPRLCHLIKWPDFNGFGFNLHAERGKAGQFIGKVDEGSPAEAAGLKPRDRIVEVNGANIGNENHQQVVMRIKAGGDEAKLLVVDDETDAKYKEMKTVIRADLPEVLYKRADPRPGQSQGNDVEAEVEPSSAPSYEAAAVSDADLQRYRPRYCHMRKWEDFDGYGFNLHAEKDKPGQYIGKIDESSPAEAAHLKEGDRIVEVNEENIEDCTHQQVIAKIKAGGNETRMLVVDKEVDDFYKSHSIKVHNGMPQIDRYATPPTSGRGDDNEQSELQAAAVVAAAAAAPQAVDVEVEQGGIGSMEEPEPEVQAEPEQETLVAAQAEVVEAYSAATDEGPGLATEAAEAEEYQEQPPASQEEEEAVEEEKVEAERNAEAEAEPEVAQPEAEDEQEVSEAVASLALQEAPEEPSEPEAPQAVNGEDEPAATEPEPPKQEEPQQQQQQEEEKKEEEKVEEAKAEENGTVDTVQEHPQATVITVRASSTSQEEEQEQQQEQQKEEEAPVSQKPMNGQQTVISQPEPVREPEPTPAPAPAPAPVSNGDPLAISAKEMRERLAAKKRSDPRNQKMDFRTKHQLFEKM